MASRKREVVIQIGLCVPVRVELRMQENEDGTFTVTGGQFPVGQQPITERFIGEHCNEDDLNHIDELAREALGKA